MEYKTPCVYIVTNKRNGTLYIGVTSDIVQCIWQHRNKFVNSFSAKYNLTRLVYYEVHGDMYEAITREKQLKRWRRSWKIKLIEDFNSGWEDLYDEVC